MRTPRDLVKTYFLLNIVKSQWNDPSLMKIWLIYINYISHKLKSNIFFEKSYFSWDWMLINVTKEKLFSWLFFKLFFWLLLSTNSVRTDPYTELDHHKNNLVRHLCPILVSKIVGLQIWAKIIIFSSWNLNILTCTLQMWLKLTKYLGLLIRSLKNDITPVCGHLSHNY